MVATLLQLVILVTFLLNGWVLGYRYGGLYAVLDEDPPSEPLVVDIHGAFEVFANVRFDDLTESDYQTVVDFTRYNTATTNIEQQISFVKVPPGAVAVHSAMGFQIHVNSSFVGAVVHELDPASDEGKVLPISFGVTESLEMFIKIDHSIVTKTSITSLPLPVTYEFKNIGAYGVIPSEHFNGLIEGLKIKLADRSDAHKAIFLQNIPGQLLDEKPFQMEMYVRFEDDTRSRSGQTIFEFTNGLDTDVISLYQVGNSTSLRFEITQNGSSYGVTAPNCITINQFSLWQVGIAPDRSMWIKKDHVEIANTVHNIYATGTFRQHMLIGRSLEASADPFRGVILGLRLGKGT